MAMAAAWGDIIPWAPSPVSQARPVIIAAAVDLQSTPIVGCHSSKAEADCLMQQWQQSPIREINRASYLLSLSQSCGFHASFKKASSKFHSDVIYWLSGYCGPCICAMSVARTEISEWKEEQWRYENYPLFPHGSPLEVGVNAVVLLLR